MKIEIVECEDGDWVELFVDGKEVYSGHEVHPDMWPKLLRQAGATVVERTVTAHDLGSCSIGCDQCGLEIE